MMYVICNFFFQEISAVGSVDLWVIALYWKSIGHWLAMATLLSLLLMQISRNTTDLWLSFWVSSMSSSNTTNLTSLDEGVLELPSSSPITYTPSNMDIKNITKRELPIGDLFLNISGDIFNDFVNRITRNITDDFYNPSQWLRSAHDPADNKTDSEVSFYLSFYAGFAVVNSILTLIRAFMFACGGIHAAVVIHKTLLKTVMRVSITFIIIFFIFMISFRRLSKQIFSGVYIPIIFSILMFLGENEILRHYTSWTIAKQILI